MQIKLTPQDVNNALLASLRTKGIDVDSNNVQFTFANRRTKGGIFAEVVIGTPIAALTPVPVVPKTEAESVVIATPVADAVATPAPASLFA